MCFHEFRTTETDRIETMYVLSALAIVIAFVLVVGGCSSVSPAQKNLAESDPIEGVELFDTAVGRQPNDVEVEHDAHDAQQRAGAIIVLNLYLEAMAADTDRASLAAPIGSTSVLAQSQDQVHDAGREIDSRHGDIAAHDSVACQLQLQIHDAPDANRSLHGNTDRWRDELECARRENRSTIEDLRRQVREAQEATRRSARQAQQAGNHRPHSQNGKHP